MSYLERIILLIYFPQFSSPNNSRFESFFLSIVKENNKLNKKIKNSKIIFPEKIARNEDKRTSIIIKGIPNNLSKSEFKNYLDKFGNINYFYITKETKNKRNNTSIAFINVINYKSIIPLFMDLRNLNQKNNSDEDNIEISYANIQGKIPLKEYVEKKYLKFRKNKD
jgi:predicted HNH restriction endonuclease